MTMRLMLGLIMALGAALAWSTVSINGYWFAMNWLSEQDQAVRSQHLVVTTEGEVFRQEVVSRPIAGNWTQSERILDLQGQEIHETLEANSLITAPISLGTRSSNTHLDGMSLAAVGEPMNWEKRLQAFQVASVSRSRGAPTWFLVGPARRGDTAYFVGYDEKTRARIGYLGRNGFSTELPPVDQQFPGWTADGQRLLSYGGYRSVPYAFVHALNTNNSDEGYGTVLLAPDWDELFVVNFTGREVRRIPIPNDAAAESAKTPANRTVLNPGKLLGLEVHVSHHVANGRVDHQRQFTQLALRYQDRVEVRQLNLDLVRTIKLPASLQAKSNERLTLYLVENSSIAMTSEFQRHEGRAPQNETLIRWLDAEGQVTREARATEDWPTAVMGDENHLAATLMPLSVGLAFVSTVTSPWGLYDIKQQTQIRKPGESVTWEHVRWYWGQAWKTQALALVVCGVAGLLSAALIWDRQRRYQTTAFETAAWMLMAFVFGPCGWIAYISHRTWPPRRVT